MISRCGALSARSSTGFRARSITRRNARCDAERPKPRWSSTEAGAHVKIVLTFLGMISFTVIANLLLKTGAVAGGPEPGGQFTPLAELARVPGPGELRASRVLLHACRALAPAERRSVVCRSAVHCRYSRLDMDSVGADRDQPMGGNYLDCSGHFDGRLVVAL